MSLVIRSAKDPIAEFHRFLGFKDVKVEMHKTVDDPNEWIATVTTKISLPSNKSEATHMASICDAFEALAKDIENSPMVQGMRRDLHTIIEEIRQELAGAKELIAELEPYMHKYSLDFYLQHGKHAQDKLK